MRAARMAFWLVLLTPAALSAQWQDSTAVAALVPVARAAEPGSSIDPLASRTDQAPEPARVHPPSAALRGMGRGALIGALVGAAAFGIMEVTDDHWDHSEDGLVFALLVVPATAVGALIGLITSL